MKSTTICVTVAGLLLLAPVAGMAQTSAYLPVQGVLSDATGKAISTQVSLGLSLYDADSGGTALWTETQQVLPDNGLFTVYLGQNQALPAALFRDHPSLWLGIKVETDSEMPRIPLGSTPYTGFAQYCGVVPDHSHSFQDLTGTVPAAALPAGVLVGAKACSAGQAVTGVSATGALICAQSLEGPAGQSVVGILEAPGPNCPTGGVKYTSAAGTAYVCNGEAGTSVSVATEAPGANCAAGGVRLIGESGVSYLCNGSTGAVGATGSAGQSVTSSPEAAGANCPAGGVRYVSASGTNYVCNGPQGATGAPGATGAKGDPGVQGAQGVAGTSVTSTVEPPGTNCPMGGVKYVSASGTNYVCNGIQGSQGIQGPKGETGATGAQGVQGIQGPKGDTGAAGVSVVGASEPPGGNCAYGGSKFTSLSGDTYVCAGAPGATGPQGSSGQSVAGIAEPAGSNCAAGGVKYTSATETTYVCNGLAGPQGPAAPDIAPAVLQLVFPPRFIPTSCATNASWTRTVCNIANGTNLAAVYKNEGGNKGGMFANIGLITRTPVNALFCFDLGTGYFYSAANGGTVIFRNNDSDAAEESTMSISGTAVTKAIGIASDGSSLYVLDDLSTSKVVRRYSIGGTSLTHVSSTPLDDNNADTGLVVVGSTWYSYLSSSKTLKKFDSTGTTIGSRPFWIDTYSYLKGIAVDPDNSVRLLAGYSTGMGGYYSGVGLYRISF